MPVVDANLIVDLVAPDVLAGGAAEEVEEVLAIHELGPRLDFGEFEQRGTVEGWGVEGGGWQRRRTLNIEL